MYVYTNIILRHVGLIIVAVEKRQVLHSVCVFECVCVCVCVCVCARASFQALAVF
jgi:hypothetical protein